MTIKQLVCNCGFGRGFDPSGSRLNSPSSVWTRNSEVNTNTVNKLFELIIKESEKGKTSFELCDFCSSLIRYHNLKKLQQTYIDWGFEADIIKQKSIETRSKIKISWINAIQSYENEISKIKHTNFCLIDLIVRDESPSLSRLNFVCSRSLTNKYCDYKLKFNRQLYLPDLINQIDDTIDYYCNTIRKNLNSHFQENNSIWYISENIATNVKFAYSNDIIYMKSIHPTL